MLTSSYKALSWEAKKAYPWYHLQQKVKIVCFALHAINIIAKYYSLDQEERYLWVLILESWMLMMTMLGKHL